MEEETRRSHVMIISTIEMRPTLAERINTLKSRQARGRLSLRSDQDSGNGFAHLGGADERAFGTCCIVIALTEITNRLLKGKIP